MILPLIRRDPRMQQRRHHRASYAIASPCFLNLLQSLGYLIAWLKGCRLSLERDRLDFRNLVLSSAPCAHLDFRVPRHPSRHRATSEPLCAYIRLFVYLGHRSLRFCGYFFTIHFFVYSTTLWSRNGGFGDSRRRRARALGALSVLYPSAWLRVLVY